MRSIHFHEVCQICGKTNIPQFWKHIENHGWPKELYAEIYNMSEWTYCLFCGKRFFRFTQHQLPNRNTCSISCASKLKIKRWKESGKIKEIFAKILKKKEERGIINKPKSPKKPREQIVREANERREQTCMRLYGVPHVAQSKEIKEKVRQQNQELYGVDCFWQRKNVREACNSPDACAKRTKNMRERGTMEEGHRKRVEHLEEHPEIMYMANIKGHDTKKRNGTYRSISNRELAYCWMLNLIFKEHEWELLYQIKIGSKECAQFTNDNSFNLFWDFRQSSFTFDVVLIHKETNHPFFLPFDGVYYHGLDYPMIKIIQNKTKHKRVIFDTFYRDRDMETYCDKHCISLIRLDENSFKKFVFHEVDSINFYFASGNSNFNDLFFNAIRNFEVSYNN